jgi:peptidoglycan hydrolase-like protein with peptidoglycan-binding domain
MGEISKKIYWVALTLFFPISTFAQSILQAPGVTSPAPLPVVTPIVTPINLTSPHPVPTIPPAPILCPYEKILLRPGMSGEEVKSLQSILSQDPSIYPQGIVSGYYGSLTSEAVKRLQQKLGLPQTGIVDENTRKYIFPCATIEVIYPNGGETWNVGDTVEIKWNLSLPSYILERNISPSQPQLKPPMPNSTENLPTFVPPIAESVSIDLIRYDGPMPLIYPAPVYYHIGNATLFDRSFKWTIPSDIAESKMYKIRVSLWRRLPEPFMCKTPPCPMLPQMYPIRWQGNLWDESDNYFTIRGGVPATPLPTVPPIPDIGKLTEVRTQLMQAIESIQKALKLIEELLGPLTPPIRKQ